jgi:hypothetical protein
LPDDEQNHDDKFGPEAIAARVDRIGAETEADRIAREEENKLLQRRKQKKTALEEAASKRLAKIGEATVKRPTVALPSDPLGDRAAVFSKWLQRNRGTFAGLVGIVVIGVGAAAGWWYWQEQRSGEASVLLGQAFAAEHGRLASKDDDEDEKWAAARQLFPSFKTAAEQREAALAKYRRLETTYAGTGAAIVSRLSEAALLLDGGDAAGARAAYEEVASSTLAKADPEVRGRALEGRGFADELLGDGDPDHRDKHLDAAMADYRALEVVGVDGFKELGLYHQARIAIAKADQSKAIELLKDVNKRVEDSADNQVFVYLKFRAEDRLRELDPSAVPPKMPAAPGGGGSPGGGPDMSDPKIQELIRQLQQKAQPGGGGAPVSPPAPTPPGAP